MGTLWVAVLHVSSRTAAKIQGVHHLDPEDVRSAVVCVSGLVYTWDEHPERGLRALVRAAVGGRDVLVVLYPREGWADEYNLGSAYHHP